MATGLQGASVVRHLSKAGKFHVRALTRNPKKSSARDLSKLPNVEIVKADFLQPETLEKAFCNAYGIFGNTTPTTKWKPFLGSMVREFEMQQAHNLLSAVKKVASRGSLKHFVFSSVCRPKDPLKSKPEPGHFSSKWDIEEAIKEIGVRPISTFLRPVSYFENFYSHLPGVQISSNYFPGVVSPNTPWQTLAVDDVGQWTARIFEKPDKFLGDELNIAGEELTGNQMAELLNKIINESNQVKYRMVPRFLMGLIEYDIAVMANWIERSGYGANLLLLKELASEIDVKITSLEKWLRSKYKLSSSEA